MKENTVTLNILLGSVLQCIAVQCNSVQCSGVQCRAVQFSACQCSAIQYSAVQSCSVQSIPVQFSAVQCSVVYFWAVQWNSVHFCAVQCSAFNVFQCKVKIWELCWEFEPWVKQTVTMRAGVTYWTKTCTMSISCLRLTMSFTLKAHRLLYRLYRLP